MTSSQRPEAESEPASSAPQEPMKSNQSILDQEVRQAEEELTRPVWGLLISGLLAGFGVGIGVLAMAV